MRIKVLSRSGVRLLAVLSAAGVVVSAADAALIQVRVRTDNLAVANSVSFAPLRVGFHNGTFDSFNNNEAAFLLGAANIAAAPITSVAEGGSGSTWFPAFAAAEPNATLDSVAGPLLPGATAFTDFTIDTSINQFFTFASMVVPSNDHFIGNDSPTRFRLFDDDGNLLLNTIEQRARDIWDNGTETTDPLAAAFLQVGTNALRTDQNSVVTFNFDQLTAYNGLTTAPGYVFESQLNAADLIYRISFEVIPTPGVGSLLAGAGLVALRRRRRAV